MNNDQTPGRAWIEPTLCKAFKHGRLVTRKEAVTLSQGLLCEMDQYIATRSMDELKTVVRYVHEKLNRIAAKARS